MQAFADMTAAHPIAATWVALSIWVWIEIYARTGGGNRRKLARRRVTTGS